MIYCLGPVNVCKLFIFRNIFSGIEKTFNTFSIIQKKFSKNENYCVSLEHTLVNSFRKFLMKKQKSN